MAESYFIMYCTILLKPLQFISIFISRYMLIHGQGRIKSDFRLDVKAILLLNHYFLNKRITRKDRVKLDGRTFEINSRIYRKGDIEQGVGTGVRRRRGVGKRWGLGGGGG